MADLKTIMRITQEELKRQLPVEQAVEHALEALSARENDTVQRRYGLRDGNCETLQQIGQEFSVTRERVRQIENQGLKKLAQQLSKKPLSDIVHVATEMIRERGGAVACEALTGEFLPASQRSAKATRCLLFLLERIPGLTHQAESRRMNTFYAQSPAHQQAVEQVEPVLAAALAEAKAPLGLAELTAAVKESKGSAGVGYLINEEFIESCLQIGKRFVPTGDRFGLAAWPEINPRNIRDKTLYVMKTAGEPLHFKQITEQIRAAHFDAKRVTVQAVHNELINGDEFVLIGRGIYALGDWGYIPGTVADVIQTILETATQPLDREEIISKVLKLRHVSRNTILINLQEKRLFAQVEKHSYALVSSPAEKAA